MKPFTIILTILLLAVFTVGAYFIGDWYYSDATEYIGSFTKWLAGVIILLIAFVISLIIWAITPGLGD